MTAQPRWGTPIKKSREGSRKATERFDSRQPETPRSRLPSAGAKGEIEREEEERVAFFAAAHQRPLPPVVGNVQPARNTPRFCNGALPSPSRRKDAHAGRYTRPPSHLLSAFLAHSLSAFLPTTTTTINSAPSLKHTLQKRSRSVCRKETRRSAGAPSGLQLGI